VPPTAHRPTTSIARPRSSRALAACLAVLLGLALPAPAFGHAVLLSTSPERGAQLDEAPRQVAFEFNEPVEASFGAVRVFDGQGDRVDDDKLTRPGGRSQAVGVGLPPDLGPGTYTATYRVVSADSHPISGGMVFEVGSGGESAVTVSDLLDEGDAGAVTSVGFGIVRGLAYAAMALALGGLLFMLAVWGPVLRRLGDASEAWQHAAAALARRSRALIAAGVLIGLVTSVLGLAFQGAIAGGTSVWAAFDPAVLEAVLETRFGEMWALRALLWLVLGAIVLWPRSPVRLPVLQPARLGADGVAAAPSPSPVVMGAIAVLAVAIAVTPGLSGHAGTASPAWLIVGADTLHVLAMCAWIGGLVFLLVAVPAATRRLDGARRTRVLAATLLGVSPIALVSVLVLLGTGIAQSIALLGAIADLWETGFGRAILVKCALFLALVGLGAHHRRRGIPRLRALTEAGEPPARAGVVVRRALRAEVVLFAGVLAATSVLVASSPAAAGPSVLSERVTVGSAAVEVTVEPLQVGPNEMHFYLFDGADGGRLERIDEMQVELRLPAKDIGPIPVRVNRAGPGHYVANRADVGVPGDWELLLRLRLSKFDVYSARLPVEIR
jgi:copper transport protein